MKTVVTTDNYFAQGQKILLSSPSTALRISTSKSSRREIGESRLYVFTPIIRFGSGDARAGIRVSACRDSEIRRSERQV